MESLKQGAHTSLPFRCVGLNSQKAGSKGGAAVEVCCKAACRGTAARITSSARLSGLPELMRCSVLVLFLQILEENTHWSVHYGYLSKSISIQYNSSAITLLLQTCLHVFKNVYYESKRGCWVKYHLHYI